MIEQSTSEKDSGATFADVVGQRKLKEALLAVATDDNLDGLLVEGEKGTAKSTAVRALGELLPAQRVVADCPYGCHPTDETQQCADCRDRSAPPVDRQAVPVVTLPLGATRDRVVGTLSVADAMAGDAEFDPGLLARANRGILYVDEVNLLEDHLVDTLLDAAASGYNRVERDGVSVEHPAEFTLIGTMNPEEGDLRPQLRDRFALHTTVTGLADLDDRVTIIERALDHDANTARGSVTECSDQQTSAARECGESVARADEPAHAERLATARESLPDVEVPAEFTTEIAELCRDAGVDGHRGDIATARAARALAALDGRTRVLESDVRQAAELALSHRLQSAPFEEAPNLDDVIDDHFEGGDEKQDTTGEAEGDNRHTEETAGSDANGDGNEERCTGNDQSDTDANADDGDGDSSEPHEAGDQSAESGGTDYSGMPTDNSDGTESGQTAAAEDGDEGDETGDRNGDHEATPLVPGAQRAGVGEAAGPELSAPDTDNTASAGSGRGKATATVDGDGPRVRTEPASDNDRIDAAASVRAAAARGDGSVESRDLRQSVRASDAETLVLFVVDASASMRPAMRAAKGTVLELLRDAYEARDTVGFVAFAGDDGEVLLPPTDSVTLAARHLKELPAGDRTPLPAGLQTARTVLDRADPDASVVVLVTDGRPNVGDSPVAETRAAASALAERDPSVVVVDAGADDDRGALVDSLVEITDGRRVPLDELSAARVDAAAREN